MSWQIPKAYSKSTFLRKIKNKISIVAYWIDLPHISCRYVSVSEPFVCIVALY